LSTSFFDLLSSYFKWQVGLSAEPDSNPLPFPLKSAFLVVPTISNLPSALALSFPHHRYPAPSVLTLIHAHLQDLPVVVNLTHLSFPPFNIRRYIQTPKRNDAFTYKPNVTITSPKDLFAGSNNIGDLGRLYDWLVAFPNCQATPLERDYRTQQQSSRKREWEPTTARSSHQSRGLEIPQSREQ
jgi:hypothetical protein